MARCFAILFALGALASVCAAESRWCSVGKRDRSNTISYPPIALAAQIQGEVRARITYKPAGLVETVEPISGAVMLAEPVERQLRNWKVNAKEPGGQPCQTIVVAVFSLHPPPVARQRHQKVTFAREPDTIRISVSANFAKIEEEASSVQTASH